MGVEVIKPILGILCLVSWVWFLFVFWPAYNKPVSITPMRSTSYEDKQRIVLPVESFGANQHIQVFRPGIPFPDNFTPALTRAFAAADKWHKTYPGMPVAITTAPRTYYVRRSITLSAKSGNVWLVGAPTNYYFTNPSASFIVNVEKENPQ